MSLESKYTKRAPAIQFLIYVLTECQQETLVPKSLSIRFINEKVIDD